MLNYQKTRRCDTNASVFSVELGDVNDDDEPIVTWGDTEAGKNEAGDYIYAERTVSETRRWMAALVAGETVENPPIAPHDESGFSVSDGSVAQRTVFVPIENYRLFVDAVQSGEEFQDYLPSQQLLARISA